MSIELKRLDRSTVEMICPEHLDRESLVAATAELDVLLKTSPARFLLVDATAMLGFDVDIARVARDYVAALKRHGIREGAAATNTSAVRMLGSTIALAAGFKLKFFDNRLSALGCVRAMAESHSPVV